MKIKNLVRFLLVVFLLATGTTPVIAHEVSQCGSVDPIRPGDTVTDAVSDVSVAHIDITEISTSLSGERLTVVFQLSDLPETLTFNRTELGKGRMEYKWEVAIDVDNDRSTGPGGFDTLLSAYHIAFLSHKGADADTTAPIGEMMEVNVWEINPDGSTRTTTPSTKLHSDGSSSTYRDGVSAISAEADTITVVGVIPGITSESRLAFEAYDAGFPGEADWIECHDPFSRSMRAWPSPSSSQCDTDEAVRPGQSITDDATDDLAAHLDVTEINTSLSGETLTVVFHFRDVPETFTFERTGVPDNATEYSWEVSIDVDGDRETGFEGFEYILSSIYVTSRGSRGRDRSAAITAVDLQTNTWHLKSAGETLTDVTFLEWARIEVSAEEDTVTLSGEIPEVTAESQLAFGVYDYLGGAEEVGCLSSFSLGRPVPLPSSSDGSAVIPGQSEPDDVSDELVGHIDILDVTTALDGETLTVIFQLRDVPATMTFDRTGVPAHALEYNWAVSIDVDNNPETGSGGFDYMLSAGYFVHPLVKDSNTAAKITDPGFVTAGILGLDGEGNRVLAEGSIEVSAAEDTITLSGEIPGITEESPLQFKAYDYFGGSVAMSSAVPSNAVPSIADLPASPCRADEAAIRPGQSVVDAVSETLPAYMDITEVNSKLTASGKLAVVFHLRDVPETLEFNRKGVREDALEYSWGVSVDVDNNRETGLQGAEYSLSASHFVFSPSSDGGVHQPIEDAVQADSWKMDADGTGTRLDSIDIAVSSEENTITLVGDVPGITSESRLVFEAYDHLNGSEEIACQVLSTAGDPAGESEQRDTRITAYALYDHYSGEDVTVITPNLVKADEWLHSWAKEAVTRDSVESHSEWTGDWLERIEWMYANGFAASERRCVEGREELAALIDAYAAIIRSKRSEEISHSRMSVAHTLWQTLPEGDNDCTAYLSALAVEAFMPLLVENTVYYGFGG